MGITRAADELRELVEQVPIPAQARARELIEYLAGLPRPATVDESAYRDIVRHMPDNLQDIAFVVGVEGAMAISRAFGGVRLYIPKTAAPNHSLVEVIGLDCLVRLSAEFPGKTIDVPRGNGWHARVKWLEIQRLKGLGYSDRDLARLFGCTERWIRYVRAKDVEPQDNGQLSLF